MYEYLVTHSSNGSVGRWLMERDNPIDSIAKVREIELSLSSAVSGRKTVVTNILLLNGPNPTSDETEI